MPFRLDLLRHGEALPAGAGGDAVRPLSDAGRRAVARMAEEFARRGWRPGRVCSSPLMRARETAAILVARAAPGLEPEILAELEPGHDPEDVVAALAALEVRPHLLLVGHQPLLGRLAGRLAGGAERPLPAGGMIWLACQGRLGSGCATVELELRPDRLR